MALRHLLTGLAAFAIANAAAAEAPSRKELRQTSWGKPGISFEQYRIDAGICAWRATNMDVADTEAARMMVKASRALDHIATAGVDQIGAAIDMRRVEDGFRVDRQFDAIGELQYDALYACLEDRGYRRFRLTEDQARQLRKLKSGSLKRHAYLHRLASDAAVVNRQAI